MVPRLRKQSGVIELSERSAGERIRQSSRAGAYWTGTMTSQTNAPYPGVGHGSTWWHSDDVRAARS